jgi:hypothetical protein
VGSSKSEADTVEEGKMMATFVLRAACLTRIALMVARFGLIFIPAVAQAQPEAAVLFRDQVGPLLRAKCLACHGGDPRDLKGGFDIRSRESLLKGGDTSEPAVVPGDPEASLLYQAITWEDDLLRMPPKANDRLTAEQVDLVRRWIAAGAPWTDQPPAAPAVSRPADWSGPNEGLVLPTSGGQSPDWTNRKYASEDVWAFRPVQRCTPPRIEGKPDLHPIDAFLLEKLQAKGLTPASPADRRTLIRRLTFDLTGLPPTSEEVEAFVQDTSPNAYSQLVERLLSSPHHGEQMARHWLDVARYADTAGFSNDFERPTAWRYRDYVVRRFNADVPYDRFVIEQIAGDELDPTDPEMLIAVGFLRMGPWEHTGMSVAAVTRQQYLDDVTNGIGVTFLGQGLRCASCHDHKFDPVPTKDYYRLQAVFAPVQFADRDVPWRPDENRSGFEEGSQRLERLLREARDFQASLRAKNKAAVAEVLKAKGVSKLEDLPPGERPDNRHGLTALEMSLQKIYEKRIAYFERSRLRYEPIAFSVYNGSLTVPTPYQPRVTMPAAEKRIGPVQTVHVLKGGALDSPGEEVSPGVLSAVSGSHDQLEPSAWNTIPNDLDGRRLALARWIASDRNSLTARVIVNRVWQMHFGKGLVATPNNFGKMGRKPSHPELLDWLATWFVEHDWSLKALHRLMVTAQAYQRSSDPASPAQVQELDASNDLLSFYPPRRLAAEEIRDAMLAITGELNPERGGPGVFPEIHWDIALQPRHIMGSVAPAYQPSPRPEQRNRRTLYTFRFRTLSDPMLDVFDRPSSEISCPVRDETTVTPQVFALFNGQAPQNRALALALRLEKEADSRTGRIARAFQRMYGRAPTSDERAWCLEHLDNLEALHRDQPPQPFDLPTTVTRRMVEELTGEPFTFEEDLDLLKIYQRDPQPWDVSAQTRALAELCLVLFNSNEFLYVR